MLSAQYLHYTAWPASYQYSTCTTLHDLHAISTVPALHCMTSMLSAQYLHYTAWPASYQYSTCTTLHDQQAISTVPALHCMTSMLSVQYLRYTAWPACWYQYSTCTTLPAYHSSKFCLHYLLVLDNFTVPVDTCQERGLPCWSLSFICLQNISQQHFLHLLLWYACSLNGTLHHHLTLLSWSM